MLYTYYTKRSRYIILGIGIRKYVLSVNTAYIPAESYCYVFYGKLRRLKFYYFLHICTSFISLRNVKCAGLAGIFFLKNCFWFEVSPRVQFPRLINKNLAQSRTVGRKNLLRACG